MAEHNNTAVHIGQLNLRIPGSNAVMARRITDEIGQKLMLTMPAGMQRHIGTLSVRVQVPSGASVAEMRDAIVGKIMNALEKGHRP